MSQKITSKNLSYDSNLPPFLRNLHAQAGDNNGEPSVGGQRRSAKKRSGSEEAEDVPVVVDEEGNVVANVEVDKEGVVKSETLEGGNGADEGKDQTERKDSEAGKAGIGGRKRKVGKVIGEAADEKVSDSKDESKRVGKNSDKSEETTKEKKPKKKVKKIKLSFDEEDG